MQTPDAIGRLVACSLTPTRWHRGARSALHLVTNVSGDIDVTVIGTSGLVVDAIAAGRAGVSRVVLPATGLGAATAHFQALHRLRPDVVHVNLAPWVGAIGQVVEPSAVAGLMHVSVGEASARWMDNAPNLQHGWDVAQDSAQLYGVLQVTTAISPSPNKMKRQY